MFADAGAFANLLRAVALTYEEWVDVVAREQARDMEPYLRGVYGERRAVQGELLWSIDYPVFDNGSAGVGFGVATDRVRRRAWLWSRVSFAHK